MSALLALLLAAPVTLASIPARPAPAAPASAAVIPAAIESAVRAALAIPGAQLELSGYRPSPASCEVQEAQLERPFGSSGTLVVHFTGKECSGAAFVRATVRLEQWVARRGLRAGDLIDAMRSLREVRSGEVPYLHDLPPGARAARPVAIGEAIDESALRTHDWDAPVIVVLSAGALRVETVGRRVPCASGRECARLSSGKRVEGRSQGDRLIVEVP